MLEKLIRAISLNNATEVHDILAENPELALHPLKPKGTILQLAISVGTDEIIKQVIAAEIQTGADLTELHLETNNNGWNALHYACCFATEYTLKLIINHLGDAVCRELAQYTPNDCGLIPACMLSKNDNYLSHDAVLRVVSLSKLFSKKSLRDEVDPYYMLQKLSPELRHPALADILLPACHALNWARRAIVISNTHLDSNKISNKQRSHHFAFMQDLRQAAALPAPKEPCEVLAWLQLARRARTSMKFSTGNCMEYACLVAYNLIRNGLSKVEILQIPNGDHAFVVLNRDQTSRLNDFQNWGDAALVIDAWAGCIFPAKNIPEKLPTFTRLYTNRDDIAMSQVNIRSKFNPCFHTLELFAAFSEDFVPAINDFYACFPFLDNFYTQKDVRHAIKLTHTWIARALGTHKGFSISAWLNPAKARLVDIDSDLQLTMSNLINDNISVHEGLTQFIHTFVKHRKIIERLETTTQDVFAPTLETLPTHQQLTTQPSIL